MCVHAWAARVNLGTCSSGARHWVFEKVSHLPSRSGWLASEPQWSVCLCLLKSELISTCHQTQPFVRVLRIKAKSCYLQNKHFTYRGIYLSSPRRKTASSPEQWAHRFCIEVHKNSWSLLSTLDHPLSLLKTSAAEKNRDTQPHLGTGPPSVDLSASPLQRDMWIQASWHAKHARVSVSVLFSFSFFFSNLFCF